MKHWHCFTTLLCIFFIHHKQLAHTNYQDVIALNAQAWKESYIEKLEYDTFAQTIIDVLLLSYQVAKESCLMMIAKLTIQEELFKIYTPSLVDSWQTTKQIAHNDTTLMQEAINTIEISQQNFQQLCCSLQSLGPQILQLNPKPTQTLITDLKDALLAWGKEQEYIALELIQLQYEFTNAAAHISDIKDIFETIVQAPTIKHVYLKEAATSVCKTYKDIEQANDRLTKVRKESIYNLQQFMITFFQSYYVIIYQQLNNKQKLNLNTQATSDAKLPLPNAFFS